MFANDEFTQLLQWFIVIHHIPTKDKKQMRSFNHVHDQSICPRFVICTLEILTRAQKWKDLGSCLPV